MQILHLKYLYWKSYRLVCYFCRVTMEGKSEPKDSPKIWDDPVDFVIMGSQPFIVGLWEWMRVCGDVLLGQSDGFLYLFLPEMSTRWFEARGCMELSGIIASIFLGAFTEQDTRSHLILPCPVPQSLLCLPSQLVIYWILSRDRELNLLREMHSIFRKL